MSKWRAERMGTAAHYENPRTIERMQRDFDGIEELSTKKPQTRADLRRMKRERDIEDEYVPDTSMQDVTGRRDKDAGKTFSHRHEKDIVFSQAFFPIFIIVRPHRHHGKFPTFISRSCQDAGSTTASCRMRACSIR